MRTKCEFSLLWLFSFAVGGWSAGLGVVRSPESWPGPSSETARSIGKIGDRFKKAMLLGTGAQRILGSYMAKKNLSVEVMEHGTTLCLDVVTNLFILILRRVICSAILNIGSHCCN